MRKRKFIVFAVLAIVMAISVYLISRGLNADRALYNIDEINKGGKWKQVTDEIFVSTGAYAKVNMVLAVSQGEAAVIDTGNNEAEALRVKEYIQKNDLVLKNLFITHMHSDHTANNSMFEVSPENQYNFLNTTDNQIIKMGDRSFRILHTPGHSNDNHISIELVEDNIIVAGDVVPTNLPPLINYGGDSNTLKKTLEGIKSNKYALIIPGHGELSEAKQAVEVQLEYLKNARALVKDLIEEGKSVKESRTIKLEQCVNRESGLTSEAKGEHYNAISKIYYEVKAEMNSTK